MDDRALRPVLGGARSEVHPVDHHRSVVGYWPRGRTVRGKAEYMQALDDLLTLLPDLRLEVPEHTMSADGEFGFSRWVMHATGANGRFEMNGMDRTRVCDGLVCENYVFFDSAEFQRLVGN
jgi:hypothetical protein